MNYLLSHVGTKVFHLGAHVHLLSGINFFATPISPWKVSHTIWLWKQEHLIITNTHALIDYTCSHNRGKCIRNRLNNCLGLPWRNPEMLKFIFFYHSMCWWQPYRPSITENNNLGCKTCLHWNLHSSKTNFKHVCFHSFTPLLIMNNERRKSILFYIS